MHVLVLALIIALSQGVVGGISGQRPEQTPSQPPPPLVATGLIVGRVIDPATGRGIAGAIVMITGGPSSTPGPPPPGAARTSPPPQPPRYFTDSEGRFAFRNLVRGSYTITATRPGYADGAHGRLRPNGPTRPVVLDDGERVGEIAIRLFKFGTIGGTVVDDSGEPIVGVSLRAYRRVLMGGRRILTPFGGNAVTDDRGEYRLSNLTPGEYVISAPMTSTTLPSDFTPDARTAPNFELTMYGPGGSGFSFGGGGRQVTADGRFLLQTGNPNAATPGVTSGADGRLRASPTVYYPAARTISEAQLVAVGSGEDRSGINLVVPLLPAANISGQLVSPEGPASGYALHLIPGDADNVAVDVSVATAVTASDGSFKFLAIPAGQYVVQATRVPRPGSAPPPPPPPPPPPGGGSTVVRLPAAPAFAPGSTVPLLWTAAPVALGESDVDGLVLMLQEGLKVSGRVEFDGAAERPQSTRLAQIPVTLEPADGKQRINQSQPGRIQPDGRFTTSGVLPGKYFLRIGGAPQGWYLRAAMLNGVDLSDVPFDLDKDVASVVVTFTDRISDLRGTVSVPSGQPSDAAVVVFPSDSDAWKNFGVNPRRMRMSRPGQDGSFGLGQLPPGDYYIVAFREEYAAEWQDPKLLEQLARGAARITLLEGERKAVDVPFHDVRPGGGDSQETRVGSELRTSNFVLRTFSVAEGGHGPFVPDLADQVRDRPVDPRSGTGSISGIVVLDGTNEPVRRARVAVSSAEIRQQRTGMTDDSGRFSIEWLPPGRYTMLVGKPAYLTTYYGARRVGQGPGTQITLAPGQSASGLTVRMQKGSVVTGTVFDAFGQPLFGARVRLMQYVMRDGERTLQQRVASGSGTTDDRGVYRLYGIMPGSYVVSIIPSSVSTVSETRQLSDDEINAAVADLRSAASLGSRVASGGTVSTSGVQVAPQGRRIPPAPSGVAPPPMPAAGRALGYSPVFYPGTALEHEAVAVTIGPGQEVSGIDITVRLVPTARVEGVLIGPTGQPAARASMSLVGGSSTSTTNYSIRLFPDGRFQAFNVAPGRYTITARLIEEPARPAPVPGAPPPPPVALNSAAAPRLTLWAQQDIQVNGEDLAGLSLQLSEAMTLSGRVVFEGKTQKLPDLATVRVSLEAVTVNRLGFSARPSILDANGNFNIEGVTPGKYRLSASVPGPQGTSVNMPTAASLPASPAWAIKSSVVNGRDTLDYPVEIQGGQHVAGAVITLTDQITELSGTIVDAAGAPVPDLTVVVFSTDRAFWSTTSRRVRAPYRSADGKYKITPLLPGEYYLAVVTEIEPGDWGDPAFMEQLAAAAIKITVSEGEKKVQDVRVGGLLSLVNG